MNLEVRPKESEIADARKAIEDEIGSFPQEFRKESDLTVSLDWQENYEDLKKEGVFIGYAKPEMINVKFNAEEDGESEYFRSRFCQLYAESFLLERMNDEPKFIWQDFLIAGFSMNFAEKYHSDATDRFLRDRGEETQEDRLVDLWERAEEHLGKKREARLEDLKDVNINLEYRLAYEIVRKLLEDYELKTIPELGKEDILGAGEDLFG